ncbi:MAG: hypothetical protein ABIB71_05410 [Candidatus Woesearchaeota archaeon]
MKRIITILCIIALLLMAGCVSKQDLSASEVEEETAAETGDLEIDADLSELEDDSLEEELEIEDFEIAELEDMDF